MKYKRIIDIAMLLLLLLLMAFPITKQKTHELLGSMMLICVVSHHSFNWKWYKALTKGKYSASRKLSIVINILLLLVVALIFLSGLTMSQCLPSLNFMSISIARRLHMVSTYWGFLLMAVHVGLHLEILLVPIKKRLKAKSTMPWTLISFIPILIATYGILMFIKHQWIGYLFMLNPFVYFDDSIKLFQMLFEYSSIFILFSIVSNRIVLSFKRIKD